MCLGGIPQPHDVLAEAFGITDGKFPQIPATWNKDQASMSAEATLNSMMRDNLKRDAARSEGKEAQVGNEDKSVNEIKYDEAIKKGKILATDAVGRMLEAQKKIDPVMQQEWKQALKGGQDGMQLQRMKWAIDRRDAYKTIRIRRVEEEFQDKVGGKYKPFARIVQDEGGDYSAYVAACNVVTNCLHLYKHWKWKFASSIP